MTFTYDDANRLTQVLQGGAMVTLSYDSANRRTSILYPNGVLATYTYDTGSRLSSMAYSLGTMSLGNLTYTYDVLGHRIAVGGSLAQVGMPASLSSTTYNAANQAVMWNGTPLTYDADGNLINDSTNVYVWNARNKMCALAAAQFQYDADGRRISKTIGGVTTTFLYAGDRCRTGTSRWHSSCESIQWVRNR